MLICTTAHMDSSRHAAPLRGLLLAVCTVLCQGELSRAADGLPLEKQQHHWMRFVPGTTRHERITTQTYNADGELQSTSVTEQRTTLLAVTMDSYTLQTETTVELAGKKVQSSNTLEHGLLADPGERVSVSELEPQRLEIQDRTVNCRVYQVQGSTDLQRWVRKLHVADVAPYILRSETASGSASDTELTQQSVEEVVALEMPYKVLTEIKPTAMRRSTRRHHKGESFRSSIVTPEVPGGVIFESTKELDSGGRLLRRSVLELVDYQIQ